MQLSYIIGISFTPIISALLLYAPYILFIQKRNNDRKNQLKSLASKCIEKYQTNKFLLENKEINYEDFLKRTLPSILLFENYFAGFKGYKNYRKKYIFNRVFNSGNKMLIEKNKLTKEKQEAYLKILYFSLQIAMDVDLNLKKIFGYKKQNKKNYKSYQIMKFKKVFNDIWDSDLLKINIKKEKKIDK